MTIAFPPPSDPANIKFNFGVTAPNEHLMEFKRTAEIGAWLPKIYVGAMSDHKATSDDPQWFGPGGSAQEADVMLLDAYPCS